MRINGTAIIHPSAVIEDGAVIGPDCMIGPFAFVGGEVFGLSPSELGYFFGAQDRDGVTRAGWTGIAMGTGFMAATALVLLLAPEYLLAIYLDPWDPANAALVGYATTFLLVGAAFQLSDGLQAVAAGALRGLKDTRIPMWIAIFSYWVPGFGLAAGLGLATQLGGLGVWIGLAVGLTFAAALLTWRWTRRNRLCLFRPAIG